MSTPGMTQGWKWSTQPQKGRGIVPQLDMALCDTVCMSGSWRLIDSRRVFVMSVVVGSVAKLHGGAIGRLLPSKAGNQVGRAETLGVGDLGMNMPSWPSSRMLRPLSSKAHQASHA